MRLETPLHTAALRAILLRPHGFVWTTMGFGMIRTYLDGDKRWRLNVWDDRLQVPGVSTIHDHPWDFTSYIIAGALLNIVYFTNDAEGDWTHEYHRIKTGEGGAPVEAPLPALLRFSGSQLYRPGDKYYQPKEWVHETRYDRGTVTLNDRSPPTAEYTARVFWPAGTGWANAMPRPAAADEVERACKAALELF